MKSSKTLVVLLAVSVFAFGAVQYVAAQDENPVTPPVSHGPNFVDEDGDGVCDNMGKGLNRGKGKGFIDADGDGVCDNSTGAGKGKGKGRGFVDADGDGKCDNMGTGRGLKRGQMGDGTGSNFVDADGDGVCDNMGKGFMKNRGAKNSAARAKAK
ncbi:MAG: hypothetical protein ACYC9O_04510 [Candidatus Latescibacterota bacterium]